MNPRSRRLIVLLVVSVLVIAAVVALSGERASSGSSSAPEPSVTTTEPQRDYVDTLQKSIDDAVALQEQQERDFLKAVEYVQAVEAEQQRQAEVAAAAEAEAERQRQAAAAKAAAAEKAQQEAAAAAKPAAAARPAAPAASSSYSGGSVWDDLAQCESHGNWSINTGNGYYGGLQMDTQFWDTYGNPAYGQANEASRSEQIAAATKARDSGRGYHPWPTCARKLGLI